MKYNDDYDHNYTICVNDELLSKELVFYTFDELYTSTYKLDRYIFQNCIGALNHWKKVIIMPESVYNIKYKGIPPNFYLGGFESDYLNRYNHGVIK